MLTVARLTVALVITTVSAVVAPTIPAALVIVIASSIPVPILILEFERIAARPIVISTAIVLFVLVIATFVIVVAPAVTAIASTSIIASITALLMVRLAARDLVPVVLRTTGGRSIR